MLGPPKVAVGVIIPMGAVTTTAPLEAASLSSCPAGARSSGSTFQEGKRAWDAGGSGWAAAARPHEVPACQASEDSAFLSFLFLIKKN